MLVIIKDGGSVTFENNICTLIYGQQVSESNDRAFCIASLYGINFSLGGGGDGVNNYSTKEQKIGTWIDEKPIYRKTIKITNGAISTTYNSLDITAIAEELNMDIPIRSFVINPDYHFNTTADIIKDGSWYLSTRLNMGATTSNKLLTIEYTKTTD